MTRRYDDRLLFKVLAYFFGIVLILTTVKDLYFINLRNESALAPKLQFVLRHSAYNLIVLYFNSVYTYQIAKFLDRRNWTITIQVIVHFFAAILFGILSYALILGISIVTGETGIASIREFNHLERIFATIDINFLIYFSILFIILLFRYFMKAEQANLEKGMLLNKLTKTRLNLLHSQLEPHFLFNSLNTISSLIHTDQNKATQVLADLGDVLRDTIMLRNTQRHSVQREVDYIQKYLNLFRARLDMEIQFTAEIAGECSHFKIPALITQPIIENIMKHGVDGVSSDEQKIMICLRFYKEGDSYRLKIENSGNRIHNWNKGTGMDLIRDRLELEYGKNYTLTLKNTNQDNVYNVYVEIVMPKSLVKGS